MKLRIKNYEEVNGFKIVRDDGRIGRSRPGRAVCKSCSNEFECDIYNLRYQKGCGCIETSPLPPAPAEVNGFKVIKDFGRVKGNRRVAVECKICGREFNAQVQNLKTAKSCGCTRRKFACKYKSSHKRLYRIYRNMTERCYNKNHKSFHNYGGRGIFVCGPWLSSPDLFCEWSLRNGYDDSLSLDRINGSMMYSPDNCRWVTVTEQNRNARTNTLCKEVVKMIKKEDRSILTVEMIANKYGLKRTTVSAVLNNHTWKDIN